MNINKSSTFDMKIGWIGAGVMGSSMVKNLLNDGYECSIFSRTKAKAESLIKAGAVWKDSPADVAKNVDVVGLIVGMPADVESVVLGEKGILSTMKPGSVLVDFTTSSPELAKRIAKKAEEKNISSLDAPVSGGDIGAQNATLSIMVGGNKTAFDNLQNFFKTLGKTIEYQGKAGAGQHTKMVNQILIATNIIGVCEALIYAEKAGLNPEDVLKSVGSGAAASWSLENLAPRIINRDFEPGFYVEHFIKDMGIALTESKKMGIELPGLNLSYNLYKKLDNEMKMGRKGTQALYLALKNK